MSVLSSITDYRRAIVAAAEGRPVRLPRAIHSVLRARFKYGFGPQFHTLFGFRDKAESEWARYITESETQSILHRLSHPDVHAFLRDKLRFALHCHRQQLDTIPILFRYDLRDDAELDTVIPNVRHADIWKTALAAAPDALFAKLIDGTHGHSAFIARRSTDGIWHFAESHRGTADDLFEYVRAHLGENRGWLFQPVIRAHPDLTRIMGDTALGTVRLISYLDADDAMHLLFPVLRIPAGNNLTDNFARGLAGNLIAPIDLNTGRLGRAAYSRSMRWPDLAYTDRHPDTTAAITGAQVPLWEEVKTLVSAAQRATPVPPTIGWDIAVTDTGPLIVEANSFYATGMHAIAYGHGLRQEFLHLVAEVQKRDARTRAAAEIATGETASDS